MDLLNDLDLQKSEEPALTAVHVPVIACDKRGVVWRVGLLSCVIRFLEQLTLPISVDQL
jgi:hypothetical protein